MMGNWRFPVRDDNVVPFRKKFYTALVDLINLYAPDMFMAEVVADLNRAARTLADEQRRRDLLEKDDR